MTEKASIRLAVFASGSGSNAQRIFEHFKDSRISAALLICNKKDAYVLQRAATHEIPTMVLSNKEADDPVLLGRILDEHNIHWIALAGYLRKIPEAVTIAYDGRIVNIHPSLLPKYGGKGMYGAKVHEAVIKNQESKSGITIHQVNAEYDKGSILFQQAIEIKPGWNAEDLAAEIHKLEHKFYPAIIEQEILAINKES